MTRFLLAALALSLAACDSDPFGDVAGDTLDIRVLSPGSGARIELGETFSVLAQITAGEDIEELGVQLLWNPPSGAGAGTRTLYREPFERPDVPTFTIDLSVTIDALDGVDGPDALDPAGQYTLQVYGRDPGGESGAGILVFVDE